MNKYKLVFFLLLLINSTAFAQKYNTHKVIKGETIYSIAKKYNIKETTIYELNPKVKGGLLQLNTVLKIPSTKIDLSVKNTEISEFHKVTKGESFYSISKKYNIPLDKLTELNPKIKPKKLKAGDVLHIVEVKKEIVLDKKVEQEKAAEAIVIINDVVNDTIENITHIVLPKETKYGVSKKYGITVQELERLNPDIKSNFPVGYNLIIKGNKEPTIIITEIEQDSVVLNSEETRLVEEFSKEIMGKADVLIEKASQYIGIKYKYGGTTPKGFDCSGLMLTTFKEIDLTLPRTSLGQANYGSLIKKNEAQKGDLIFFATRKKGIVSHVGMITEVSNDEIKFIHSSTSEGVIISSLNESYYSNRFKQINRVLN